MSYAIQARPIRPWKELVVIACLLVWSLDGVARQYGLLRWAEKLAGVIRAQFREAQRIARKEIAN